MITLKNPLPPRQAGTMAAILAIAAMEQSRVLTFDYDGKHRLVEVHTVGENSRGTLVMRGFQVAGETSRGQLPVWGLFTLDKIVFAAIQNNWPSEAPREGYTTGDKQIPTIIAEIEL